MDLEIKEREVEQCLQKSATPALVAHDRSPAQPCAECRDIDFIESSAVRRAARERDAASARRPPDRDAAMDHAAPVNLSVFRESVLGLVLELVQ